MDHLEFEIEGMENLPGYDGSYGDAHKPTFDKSSGKFHWNPPEIGQYQVTFIAKDDKGATGKDSTIIQVVQ